MSKEHADLYISLLTLERLKADVTYNKSMIFYEVRKSEKPLKKEYVLISEETLLAKSFICYSTV
jgi:hypothetical protein